MPFYFAFGSCMDIEDIRRTVPDAEVFGTGRAMHYKLAFTRYSAGRDGGVADIVKKNGEFVEGMIFYVPDFRTLDIREGHPFAYKRRRIRILIGDGEFLWCSTYTVQRKSKYEIQPSDYYAGLILSGAKRLSMEYREKLFSTLYEVNRVTYKERKKAPIRAQSQTIEYNSELELLKRMRGVY